MRRPLALILAVVLSISALTFTSAANTRPPYKGADISAWQGDVDWEKYKEQGVDYAVLRCFAYGKDQYFDQNYSGAAEAGIPLGAYVYMYATTADEAKAEAQGALDALAGRPLTLPLFLDVEDSTVRALGKTRLTELMLIELVAFENAGYNAGIYTSQSFTETYMDMTCLSGYDLWLAKWTCAYSDTTFHFADQKPDSDSAPICDMWQFSDGGSGIYYGVSSQRLDLDYCYTDYLSGDPIPYNDPRHYADPVNSLSKGAKGKEVAWLQAMLWQLGFAIQIDGSFGNATRTAVVEYQTHSGLDPDGIVGPLTRAKMEEDFAVILADRDKCVHVSKTVPGKAPTCTAPGLTDGEVCSKCGEILTAQKEVSPLGHSYGTDGKCVRCGAPESPDVPVLVGDANCDGKVDAKDASAIIRYVTGWEVTPFSSYPADLTADGRVTVKDVAALLRKLVTP